MSQNAPDENHYRLLRVLEERPALSQRELADQLKLSLGGVNYCLRALVDKGWIKVNNFRSSDNRLRYAYVLTPRGIAQKAQLTQSFLRRKLAEYERIKAEIAALEQEISRNTAAQDAESAADRTDQLQDR